MTTELDAVKNKISALLAMTDSRSGSSESEAMFAAKKMGELLQFYNLTLDDLQVRSEKVKITTVSTGMKVKSQPISVLARAVANFCDCSFYYSTKRGYVVAQGGTHKGLNRFGITDIEWRFVGLEPDADMAQYLMNSLMKAMRSDTNRFMSTRPRASHGDNRIARSNFEDGFSYRVRDRLSEMKDEISKNNVGTSQALVTTKGQMIKSFMDEQVGKLVYKRVNTTRGVNTNMAAYNAGRSAANNANLSRPLTGETGRNKLMLK